MTDSQKAGRSLVEQIDAIESPQRPDPRRPAQHRRWDSLALFATTMKPVQTPTRREQALFFHER